MSHYLEISKEEYLKHKPCRTTFFDAHCDVDAANPNGVLRIAHDDVESTLRYIAQQSAEVLFFYAKKGIIPLTIDEAKKIVREEMLKKRRAANEFLTDISVQAAPTLPEVDDGKVYSDAYGARVDPAILTLEETPSDPAEELGHKIDEAFGQVESDTEYDEATGSHVPKR